MRNYFLFIVLVIISCGRIQSQSINSWIISELDSLARSKGYEFVYGDKFPIMNLYESYGTPYAIDFFSPFDRNNLSILFLCRKYKFNSPNNKKAESWNDLVNNYDYALIFAIKNVNDKSFKIIDVLDQEIALKGMCVNKGMLEIKLSDFRKVHDKSIKGPQNKIADYRSGAYPIHISSLSVLIILYYYEGEWYQYIDRDI